MQADRIFLRRVRNGVPIQPQPAFALRDGLFRHRLIRGGEFRFGTRRPETRSSFKVFKVQVSIIVNF